MQGARYFPYGLGLALTVVCAISFPRSAVHAQADAVDAASLASDAPAPTADAGPRDAAGDADVLDGGASDAAVTDAEMPDASVADGDTDGIPELADPTTVLPPAPPLEPFRRTLRVAVAGSEPFVVDRPDGPTGISVEVFDAVATRARINYRLVRAPSAAAAIAAVARGDVDMAIGPISITAERAQYVDFTQPYFLASLGIASPETLSLWERIQPFLSRAFIVGVAGLSLVLLLIGTLIWLCERKQNSAHFPLAPLRGIGSGAWFALVTMTTVGYGDKAPITPLGRFVAGAWMVASMVIASSLIAGIATALTLARISSSGIDSADDLAGKRVAVVRGTTGVAFAQSHGARLVTLPTLAEALEAVTDGRARAIVFDRPSLSYALAQNSSLDITLAEANYRPQGYGFVFPSGSDLGHRLDVALLDFASNRQMELIRNEWLPE